MNRKAMLAYSQRCDKLKGKQDPNKSQNDRQVLSAHLSKSVAAKIQHFLNQVIQRQNSGNLMKLPSLAALLSFFKVKPEELLEVLTEFNRKGFDFEIINANEPILIWNTSQFFARSA